MSNDQAPLVRRVCGAALSGAMTLFALCATVAIVTAPIGLLRLLNASWRVAIGAGVALGLLVLIVLAWYLFEVRGAGRETPPPS